MDQSDTSKEIQEKYDSLWKNLSPEQRFIKGIQWIGLNRSILYVGYKTHYPSLNKNQLHQKMAQELYGINISAFIQKTFPLKQG